MHEKFNQVLGIVSKYFLMNDILSRNDICHDKMLGG